MSLRLENKKSDYLKVFLLGFALALFIFMPTLIRNQGILQIGSDYNTQQIPFGIYINETFKNGGLVWDSMTDLGTSFLGAYSFYNIGSPFYWLSLPFPSQWFPVINSFLLMLKYAVATTTAFAYSRQFFKKPSYALIVGVLYAFSGFQATNILYHFHDAIALFPLLLLVLDQTVLHQKKGWLIPTLVLCGLTNYYLFVGEAIFLLIYFVINILNKRFSVDWRLFRQLVIESLLALGVLMIFFLPNMVFILQNPRVSGIDVTFDLETVQTSFLQTLTHLLNGLIRTPDRISAPSSIWKYSFESCYVYLPFFGFVFVMVYLWVYRLRDWLSQLIGLSLILLFIYPLGNLFSLFTTETFRWLFMFSLFYAIATVKILESRFSINPQIIPRTILLYMGLLLFTAIGCTSVSELKTQFLMLYGVTFLQLLFFVWWFWRFNKLNPIFYFLFFFSVYLTHAFTLNLYEELNPMTYTYEIKEVEGIFSEPVNYRLDTTFMPYNSHYLFNKPSVSNFNSNVSGGVFESYAYLMGVKRTVVSCSEKYGLEHNILNSVKYLIQSKQQDEYFMLSECFMSKNNGYTHYPNKQSVFENEEFIIYENLDFIPMGFTYDSFITASDYKTLSLNQKMRVLLKAIIVEDDSPLTTVLQGFDIETLQQTESSETDRQNDLNQRKETTCQTFNYQPNGFTCSITLQKPELLFFSIPYDEGWKATVNEMAVDIEKVDHGYIGLYLNEGTYDIEFTYFPPGLKLGTFISLMSALLSVIYGLLNGGIKKTHS